MLLHAKVNLPSFNLLQARENERLAEKKVQIGVRKPEKPERKPEKPERKFNSRELIEKQKNWSSHFTKQRTSPRSSGAKSPPASPPASGTRSPPLSPSSYAGPASPAAPLVASQEEKQEREAPEKLIKPSVLLGKFWILLDSKKGSGDLIHSDVIERHMCQKI